MRKVFGIWHYLSKLHIDIPSCTLINEDLVLGFLRIIPEQRAFSGFRTRPQGILYQLFLPCYYKVIIIGKAPVPSSLHGFCYMRPSKVDQILVTLHRTPPLMTLALNTEDTEGKLSATVSATSIQCSSSLTLPF